MAGQDFEYSFSLGSFALLWIPYTPFLCWKWSITSRRWWQALLAPTFSRWRVLSSLSMVAMSGQSRLSPYFSSVNCGDERTVQTITTLLAMFWDMCVKLYSFCRMRTPFRPLIASLWFVPWQKKKGQDSCCGPLAMIFRGMRRLILLHVQHSKIHALFNALTVRAQVSVTQMLHIVCLEKILLSSGKVNFLILIWKSEERKGWISRRK